MLRSLTLAAATLVCSASFALAAPAPMAATKPLTGQKQLQESCMKAHPNDHAAFKECLKKPGEKKL